MFPYTRMCAQPLQSCPALCDPMDCSPPGSSVPGILQARILEWVAMPSSRGSSQPRDQTHVSFISCIASGFFSLLKPTVPYTFTLVYLSILLRVDITSCHFSLLKHANLKENTKRWLRGVWHKLQWMLMTKTHFGRGGLLPKQEAKAIHEEGVRPRWSPGTPREPSAGEAEHESWVSKA